jgi:hypothetical protein
VVEPIFIAVVVDYLVKNAPSWLDSIVGTILDKGKDIVLEKSVGYGRSILHLDEKEQIRHLELVLKNAVERGLAQFHTLKERDQYRSVLTILSEPGAHSEELRRGAMSYFTLSDVPNYEELNNIYNRSLRTRSLSNPTPFSEIDAAPYLTSFFEALVAELYIDPFFQQRISNAIRVRAAMHTQCSVEKAARAAMYAQRSLAEIIKTLHLINEAISDNYTADQLEQDIVVYTAHIERTCRYLKLVGIVPKDRTESNVDPELNGIFVPLRITSFPNRERSMYSLPTRTYPWSLEGSIISQLEESYHLVLLGGPGSGKSTATRYLAWCHSLANLGSSTSLSNIPLLSGNPLPIRIELRRFSEDRRQQPEYNFLSYMTKVVLGREGINIHPEMFKVLLERRAVLLLFDGLDEVATLDERRRLVEEIEHFTMGYPGNRVIVTSRPVGYELTSLSNQKFTHAQVLEFDDTQIRQFLEQWYRNVLRLTPLSREDLDELEMLFSTLQENPRLHKLAVNPLLLTVIAALHRYERLPDRRVLIYDRCADLLLETWAKLKGTHIRWKEIKLIKEDQYACVANLGFVLHSRSQEQKGTDSPNNIANDVTTRFLLQEIESFLSSKKLLPTIAEQRTEAKRFIELMQVEAGLIVERGTDESGELLYGFVHRTFQEYFAAAHIYEQYQQEEDPAIISAFLQEHLHDPHWQEVILLLLAKLKRKPVSFQLRQVFEGKIKSYRSYYTDLLQQDLFFLTTCLAEDIAVENELAERIISRLSDLAKQSLFPSQRMEVLKILNLLLWTRQYAYFARKSLVFLVEANPVGGIFENVRAAQILCENSPDKSDAIVAIQGLKSLVRRYSLSFEQVMQVAKLLYDWSMSSAQSEIISSNLDEIPVKLLLELSQRPDLSFEQNFQVAEALYCVCEPASEGQARSLQILLRLSQCPDLSFKDFVRVASALYQSGDSTSESQRRPHQMLIELLRRPNHAFEEIVQIAELLYCKSSRGSVEEMEAIQILLELMQHPDMLLEQILKVAAIFCVRSPKESEEKKKAVQILLKLIQHSNIPIDHFLQIFHFIWKNTTQKSEDRESAIKFLSLFLQKHNLSVEQTIQLAETLYLCSYPKSDEELQALQTLLHLSQQPSLSVEQIIQLAKALYSCSIPEYELAAKTLLSPLRHPEITIKELMRGARSMEKIVFEEKYDHWGTQLLSRLAKRPDLHVDQVIEIAQLLYKNGLSGSVERQIANQLLLSLVHYPAPLIEQVLLAIEKFYDRGSEQDPTSKKIPLALICRTDLPIEQTVFIAQTLYKSSPKNSPEQQQAIQVFSDLIHDSKISAEQTLMVAQTLYRVSEKDTDEWKSSRQALMDLTNCSDLSLEQLVGLIWLLYESGSQDAGEGDLARQILLSLVYRSDFSVEQHLLVAETLYKSSKKDTDERQQALQILRQSVQNQSISFDLRLQSASIPLIVENASYQDKEQAIQDVLSLLDSKNAQLYLADHFIYSAKKANISDVPHIIRILENSILPATIHDNMYRLLRDMVPQFADLDNR